MTIETIELANVLYEQGNTLTVKWVPGHGGVTGNEVADSYDREAAERRIPIKESRLASDGISASSSRDGRAKKRHATGEKIRF